MRRRMEHTKHEKTGGKRLAFAALAFVLAAAGIRPAYATRQEVEDAKKTVSSIEAEKKKLESSLKNLEGLKSDAAAYVKQLDQNLEELNGELNVLAGQIKKKESEISATQQKLEAARQLEEKQYADMKLRIKYMYERGDTSYIDMLLQSDDMVQLMNRAEYIRKISEYDRRKMDEYEETRNSIAAHEETLKEEHEELLGLKDIKIALWHLILNVPLMEQSIWLCKQKILILEMLHR